MKTRVLSEAFTNGVRYGRGKEIVVSVLARAGGVRVEVVDEGGAGVPHYVAGPCGEGGRGLPIMRALSRTWGFEVVQDGRLKVWFEVWFEVSSTSGERLR